MLTGMLTLSMGSTVYASGTDAAIAEAQAEKQAAEEGLAQVQSSIGTLESKKQELESYLADLNAQYEDLTNSISLLFSVLFLLYLIHLPSQQPGC